MVKLFFDWKVENSFLICICLEIFIFSIKITCTYSFVNYQLKEYTKKNHFNFLFRLFVERQTFYLRFKNAFHLLPNIGPESVSSNECLILIFANDYSDDCFYLYLLSIYSLSVLLLDLKHNANVYLHF